MNKRPLPPRWSPTPVAPNSGKDATGVRFLQGTPPQAHDLVKVDVHYIAGDFAGQYDLYGKTGKIVELAENHHFIVRFDDGTPDALFVKEELCRV